MMTRWPGDPDVKDDPNDPLIRRPNDPVPRLVVTQLRVDLDHATEYATRAVPAMKHEATAIGDPQDGRWKITLMFVGRRLVG